MAEGQHLRLWGFGCVWQDPLGGTIFLSRHALLPHPIAVSGSLLPVWQPAHIRCAVNWNQITPVVSFRLLSQLARWFAEYERWVNLILGRRYRALALDDWSKQIACPGSDMSRAWNTLAASLDGSHAEASRSTS
jgi:hypothetical protein